MAVGAAFPTAGQPPSFWVMSIEVSIEPEFVHVELGGINALLALKRRLDLPAGQIVRSRAMARRDVPRGEGTWLRAPGTYVPGLVRHGSYGRPPHREFWAVFRQERVLVIELRDWDYARLVLAVEQPELLAANIASVSR